MSDPTSAAKAAPAAKREKGKGKGKRRRKRRSLASEYWAFLKAHKAYWMIPIALVLLLLAGLLIFGGSSAAPYIYTLF